jgi:hypothetical protein
MYDIDKSECTNLVNQSNPAYDDSTRQCAYVGTTLQCRNNDPMIASTRAFQNSLRAFEVKEEVTKCMERRGWRDEVIEKKSSENRHNKPVDNATTSYSHSTASTNCGKHYILNKSGTCVMEKEDSLLLGEKCNYDRQCTDNMSCLNSRCTKYSNINCISISDDCLFNACSTQADVIIYAVEHCKAGCSIIIPPNSCSEKFKRIINWSTK